MLTLPTDAIFRALSAVFRIATVAVSIGTNILFRNFALVALPGFEAETVRALVHYATRCLPVALSTIADKTNGARMILLDNVRCGAIAPAGRLIQNPTVRAHLAPLCT